MAIKVLFQDIKFCFSPCLGFHTSLHKYILMDETSSVKWLKKIGILIHTPKNKN